MNTTEGKREVRVCVVYVVVCGCLWLFVVVGGCLVVVGGGWWLLVVVGVVVEWLLSGC